MMELLLARKAAAATEDPHASNVVLFIDAITNPAIVDSSGRGHALTLNGKLASVEGQGASFDGAGTFITTPYTSDFSLPGDFTLEAVVRPMARSSQYPTIFGNYNTFTKNGGLSLFAGHATGGSTRYTVAVDGAFPALSSATSVAYNATVRLAVVRKGTAVTLLVNGVAESTVSSAATIVGTASFVWIGAAGNTQVDSVFNGYIRKLRLTKGVARTTDTFLAP